MSLITICPSGTDKNSDFLFESLTTSSKISFDGIGIAYKRNNENKIGYLKGSVELLPLINEINKLKLTKEDSLVIHQRKISAGKISNRNCHPFILSAVDENIQDLGPALTHHTALFHNGYFKDFVDTSGYNSDTFNFCKVFMRNHDVLSMLKEDKEKFIKTFKTILLDNKIVLLAPDANLFNPIITIGDFVEDQGYLFSNLTYKPIKVSKIVNESKSCTDLTKYKDNLNKIINFDVYFKNKSPEVILSLNNYKELILIPKEDNIILKEEEKYDKFEIPNIDIERDYHALYKLNSADLIWCTMDEIYNQFVCRPKLAFQEKYKDYFRLKTLILPTKTSIKKISNRLIKYVSKGLIAIDQQVAIEYKNRPITGLRLDAVCMFLNEFKHLLPNGIVISSFEKLLKEKLEKDNKPLVTAETNLNTLGVNDEGIVDLNSNIQKKISAFKDRKRKLLSLNDFSQVDKAIEEIKKRTELLTKGINLSQEEKDSINKEVSEQVRHEMLISQNKELTPDDLVVGEELF